MHLIDPKGRLFTQAILPSAFVSFISIWKCMQSPRLPTRLHLATHLIRPLLTQHTRSSRLSVSQDIPSIILPGMLPAERRLSNFHLR